MQVPQPTVSKIVNGKMDKLSIDFLVKLMVRAGLSVSITAGRAVSNRRVNRQSRVAA